MRKLLVDTNVLFDYFARRHPFDQDAALLLFGCAMGDYEMWVSSSQVTDLHFLLTHGDDRVGREQAVETLVRLREHVRIASLTEADVDEAMASGWRDFEDACVYFVARHMKASCIITRNKKDFANAALPVLTPREFLDQFESEEGISYDNIEWK